MTRRFLFILVLISNTTLFSQTIENYKICGTVISISTGESIPFAKIMITNNNGVQSDSLGNFIISGLLPGKYNLKFETMGYPKVDTIVEITNRDLIDFKWYLIPHCTKYNKTLAMKNIEENNLLILLHSGIVPIVYSTDNVFEKRYKVKFLDFGCIAGDYNDCLVEYNRTIFEHLDKTYGKKWRQKIRKDAIGLK